MNRLRLLGGVRSYVGVAVAASATLTGCGGGSSGNVADSGTSKTYLSVEASDPDGDPLQYQWRVTAGSVENRNASQTVWTMPDGPGLHFAYVTISDGKGGYVERQYAVGTDLLDTSAPARTPVSHVAPAVTDFDGSPGRLRIRSSFGGEPFAAGGGASATRYVYLPDVTLRVLSGATEVFSGTTDLSGEVSLPKLPTGSYTVQCATSPNAPLVACGGPFTIRDEARVHPIVVALTPARNLRLHGHVGLADGDVCARQSEFFAVQKSATVQLLAADGTALTPAVRVNRFGDYAIDAAVPVRASLKLQVQCDSYRRVLDVPASADPAGYLDSKPVELSHQIANSRPVVVKMVGNGPEGNVRGRMIVPEPGVVSEFLPGPLQFLAYKGTDTRLGACMYYRSFGAVKDCDAQGNMIEPIAFDDWKRQHRFKPYNGALAAEVSANYINTRDLNLVRRMVATQAAPDNIAFYVCNHPGPFGTSQAEVDAVLDAGLAGEKQIACVAMEWSPTLGVNNGKPFTKFLTFAPDGSLIASINLDGRGEKYMPGTCVACHGGTKYNGRFPEKGNPSPYLGSGFLPFDTNNFRFGSDAGLSEQAQSAAFYELNRLTRATEPSDTTAVSELVKGWYKKGGQTLDKFYVPEAWSKAERDGKVDAEFFYREVVGTSCRTCHASLGPTYNWDAIVLDPSFAQVHVCGGTEDLVNNASMPNALASRDRLSERVHSSLRLADAMRRFLGCSTPAPDPVYPQK